MNFQKFFDWFLTQFGKIKVNKKHYSHFVMQSDIAHMGKILFLNN